VKTIDLSKRVQTLEELLALASEEGLILRTPEGREFILAEADDLSQEIELVRRNQELMQFLEQRSREAGIYTLKQVREKLNRSSS